MKILTHYVSPQNVRNSINESKRRPTEILSLQSLLLSFRLCHVTCQANKRPEATMLRHNRPDTGSFLRWMDGFLWTGRGQRQVVMTHMRTIDVRSWGS